MTRVDLSSVYTKCVVRGCTSHNSVYPLVQRHHRGCEKLFVRHFAHKEGTERYDSFKLRYEAFDPRDVVPLCGGHHRVVHEIVYAPVLRRYFRKVGKPVRKWSWRQAIALVNALRKACDEWLETTSGKPILPAVKSLKGLTF